MRRGKGGGRHRPSGGRVTSRSRRSKAPSERKVRATRVTAADLRALRREIARKARPMRWNPDAEEVQKSVAQLVLTVVEFLRRLMERQAIRRMEQKTLTRKEVENVGVALMKLEETVRDIGQRFGLSPEDLNLDLGPAGRLM